MKTPLLINIFTFIIITTFVGGSSTRADTFDLLEMSEKLDQADKQDFISSIDKANACIRQHNFKCTETELTKASKMANGSRDKQMLLSVRENMTNEKNMILKEQQRIAEEERRAKVAEAERLRQQQAAADKSNDFQWGKLAAMGVGAAIGGVGHLSSEVQTKILTAAIKDSMGGQEGMGNVVEVTNSRSNTSKSTNSNNQAGSGMTDVQISQTCQASYSGPTSDPQTDQYCKLAAFDQCLAKHGHPEYLSESASMCKTLKGLLQAAHGTNTCTKYCP